MRALTLLRHSPSDALLVAAALGQGALTGLVIATAAPAAPPTLAALALLFAGGLWWSSNTVAHNHLHNPLFRARALNQLFSLYLTLLVGVPQSLWKARHLWHHGGERVAFRWPRLGALGLLELAATVALWAALLAFTPRLFLLAYLPGYLAGMALCHAQGHYEHAGGAGLAGVSFYGRLYNRLWFNDGYHAEHHARPAEHWRRLPQRRLDTATASPLPPLLRWSERWLHGVNRLQAQALVRLERLALASTTLQGFMVASHAGALRALLPALGDPARIRRIGIIGGGLFPRSALVVDRVLPGRQLVAIDADPGSIATARAWLAEHDGPAIEFVCQRFDPRRHSGFDLLVVPLGYLGDRAALLRQPPAPLVIVHDWLWQRRGDAGVVVSWLLGKRINLARRRG